MHASLAVVFGLDGAGVVGATSMRLLDLVLVVDADPKAGRGPPTRTVGLAHLDAQRPSSFVATMGRTRRDPMEQDGHRDALHSYMSSTSFPASGVQRVTPLTAAEGLLGRSTPPSDGMGDARPRSMDKQGPPVVATMSCAVRMAGGAQPVLAWVDAKCSVPKKCAEGSVRRTQAQTGERVGGGLLAGRP
ncbi:uncharacterized protein PSFLO_01548 [Pseudozyma flocculosa]|uniref:Uncharacterized protein n=1 Tax=Pseudozyma flocculosa TaxID=84751 RepID=A0A5C3EXH2_9BASI|nr:uncharacterized protein PSFLO_01548 [Pseudozyma flocculosa]